MYKYMSTSSAPRIKFRATGSAELRVSPAPQIDQEANRFKHVHCSCNYLNIGSICGPMSKCLVKKLLDIFVSTVHRYIAFQHPETGRCFTVTSLQLLRRLESRNPGTNLVDPILTIPLITDSVRNSVTDSRRNSALQAHE